MSDVDFAILDEEPAWNKHVQLHQRCDPDECTECAIEARHAARVADLIEFHGSLYTVPMSEFAQLSEQLRKEWTAYSEGPKVSVVPRKRNMIQDWVKSHPGVEFTVPALAEEIGCGVAAVYDYISQFRYEFRKTGTGTYMPIDVAAARAAELIAAPTTLPVAATEPPGAVLVAPTPIRPATPAPYVAQREAKF